MLRKVVDFNYDLEAQILENDLSLRVVLVEKPVTETYNKSGNVKNLGITETTSGK